jgi:hypothetical protein
MSGLFNTAYAAIAGSSPWRSAFHGSSYARAENLDFHFYGSATRGFFDDRLDTPADYTSGVKYVATFVAYGGCCD